MSALEISLSLPEFSLKEELQIANDSRGMFIARLEQLQKERCHIVTIQAVFDLLSDCDMLAQTSVIDSMRA